MNRWPLFVILGLFVFACFNFASITPYRSEGFLRYQRDPKTGGPQKVQDVGAPDERQHANYVRHLLDGKGFPVLVPGSPDLGETYQSHQPPLYYLLAAGWSKVLGADPTDAKAGVPIRSLNIVIGLVGLLGVYFAAKWAKLSEGIALASTAAVGLMPMNIALHAAVSNDPLLFCLCSWGFAWCVRGLYDDSFKASPWIAGLMLGLALLTKTTGVVLVLLLLTCAFVAMRRSAKPTAWIGAIALGLAISAPWLLRNQSLYGDLFGLKVFASAFVGSPQASTFIEGVGLSTYLLQFVAWWTWRSFIGTFGYMDIFFFENLGMEKSGSLYNAIWLVLLVIMAGTWLAPKLGMPYRDPEAEVRPSSKPLQILCLVLAASVLLLFVRFNLQFFQGQARYLYPAIVVFGLAIGTGAASWLKHRHANAWILVVAILLPLDLVATSQLGEAFAVRTQGIQSR